ncbi:hypothetical protein ES703_53596 [subsurface metagenome]
MKRNLLIPLLMILSGCATYYVPVTEYEEFPEYVEGDSSYYVGDGYEYTDYSASYESAHVYPWWSVDYFYLGSHQSRSNFSVGINYGHGYNNFGYSNGWYDPFYQPYSPYSYYSPLHFSWWYAPYYDYGYRGYASNDYYWRNRYNRHHRARHRDHDRNRDRYAYSDQGRYPQNGNRRDRNRDDSRNGRYGGDDRNGEYRNRDYRNDNSTLRPRTAGRDLNRFDERERLADRDRRRGGGDRLAPPPGSSENTTRGRNGNGGAVRRQVSVAPGRSSNERGMEVRSREERKQTRTRMEPVKSAPVRSTTRAPSSTVVAASTPTQRGTAYTSTRSSVGEVRRNVGGKKGRTHLSPVVSQSAPASIQSRSARSSQLVSSRNRNGTIRTPAADKSRQTRTQPVKPRTTSPQVLQPRSPQSLNSQARTSRSSPRVTSMPALRTRSTARQGQSVAVQRPSAPVKQQHAPQPGYQKSAPPKKSSAKSGGSKKNSNKGKSSGNKGARSGSSHSNKKGRR